MERQMQIAKLPNNPENTELTRLVRTFRGWIDQAARGVHASVEPLFLLRFDSATVDATCASAVIRQGVRAGRVSDLVALLGYDKKEELGRTLNANNTSLWRWERDDKLLPVAIVEQLLRTMQLQLFATEVFGTVVAARKWLHASHPALEGMTPTEYANNEFGAQKVKGMLAGLKYGSVA